MKTSTTYNKSKIMREAHYWKMVLRLSISESLKMAWRNAKALVKQTYERIEKANLYNKLFNDRKKKTKSADMSHLANTLGFYYEKNTYNGD